MRFIFWIFCWFLFTVQTLFCIERSYNSFYSLNFLCGLDGNASVTLRNNILFECLMAFSFIRFYIERKCILEIFSEFLLTSFHWLLMFSWKFCKCKLCSVSMVVLQKKKIYKKKEVVRKSEVGRQQLHAHNVQCNGINCKWNILWKWIRNSIS